MFTTEMSMFLSEIADDGSATYRLPVAKELLYHRDPVTGVMADTPKYEFHDNTVTLYPESFDDLEQIVKAMNGDWPAVIDLSLAVSSFQDPRPDTDG